MLAVVAGDENRTTYLCEQRPTRRLVTLEILSAGAVEGLTLARFELRLKSLARLTHPGIARILDGQLTAAGDYCVVATYVPGLSIDRYCHRDRAAPVNRARLFCALCRAIEHAHAHEVVHGRLTPDLVVVTGTGDAATPVVTGFSVCSETVTVADDVRGLTGVLEAIEGAAAHSGPALNLHGPFASVAALRQAVEGLFAIPPSPRHAER